MSVTVSDPGGGDFVPAPAGTHIARCVQVIDLGTQASSYYKNDDGTPQEKHKVVIGWELPTELQDSGEPFLVWNRYTASLHENSALRPHLEAWRGRKFSEEELKGFLLSNILDKPCMLNIVHNEGDNKVYANVAAVMAMPKGQACPDRVHDLLDFDINNFDQAVFDKLGESTKKTINNSKERRGLAATPPDAHEPTQQQGGDDDVPF